MKSLVKTVWVEGPFEHWERSMADPAGRFSVCECDDDGEIVGESRTFPTRSAALAAGERLAKALGVELIDESGKGNG